MNTEDQNQGKRKSPWRLTILITAVVIVLIVVILALLGPTVGNVFPPIPTCVPGVNGCDGLGGL